LKHATVTGGILVVRNTHSHSFALSSLARASREAVKDKSGTQTLKLLPMRALKWN